MGSDAHIAHRFFSYIDHVFHRFDFLPHVVVLVLDVDFSAVGEFVVDFSHKMLELLLAAFEAVAVVVAYYIGHHGLFHVAFD